MKHLKKFKDIKEQQKLDIQLVIAIHQNKIDMVKSALEAGANPNIKDNFNTYIIIVSVFNSNLSIVKELLKAGANPDVQNKLGYTPLIDAARDRRIRSEVRSGFEKNIYQENILEELIKAGANWNLKNNDGEDFFDYLPNSCREPLIDKYPEQYKEYLIKKDLEKFEL